jgi:hypothetical protein
MYSGLSVGRFVCIDGAAGLVGTGFVGTGRDAW